MKAALIKLISALLAWRAASADVPGCSNATVILEAILSHYSKSTPPANGVQVESEVWIQSMRNVNDLQGTMDMTIFLSQLWLDARLAFDHMAPCKQNITPGHQFFGRIWTPNTVFINSVRADIALSPTPNLFVMLYPNGTVWTNQRLALTAPCVLYLERYPHDHRECSLTFESFTHNADVVDMRWTGSGVTQLHILHTLWSHTSDFAFTGARTARTEVQYPAGRWAELTFTVALQRRWGWHLLYNYLPVIFTVAVSWAQLCLGPNALAARAVVAVVAFLQMLLLAAYAHPWNAPKISYIRSLDVFNLFSALFIVANVLELAVVGMCVGWSPANVVPSQCGADEQAKHANWARRTKCIDVTCLAIFALLYLIAVVIYFAV